MLSKVVVFNNSLTHLGSNLTNTLVNHTRGRARNVGIGVMVFVLLVLVRQILPHGKWTLIYVPS